MPPKTLKKKVTRSAASKQHIDSHDSLFDIGSPYDSRKNKRSRKKQAPPKSPKEKGVIPQVVTVTKEAKTSEDENSSNDDNSTASALPVTNPVTMSGNLTPGADPRLDKKLDHVLEEFVLAKGGNNDIRQTFKEEELTDFRDFVTYELEHIQDLRRKQGNTTKVLNKQKVTQVYNAIRYYNYLLTDPQDSDLAMDPENWLEKDFRLWKRNGHHPSVTSATAAATNAASSNANTTTNTNAPTVTVCADTKKAENAWLSWQRTKRDVEKYPILSNDREYSDWSIFMSRQFEADRCSRMIDDNFVDTDVI